MDCGATQEQSQSWRDCRLRKMQNGVCAAVLNISQPCIQFTLPVQAGTTEKQYFIQTNKF